MTYTRTMTGSALPTQECFADVVIAWAKAAGAARKVAALAEAYNEMKAEGGFEYGEE